MARAKRWWEHVTTKGRRGHCDGWWNQSSNHSDQSNSLTATALGHWPIDRRGVPRREIDRKLTESLLDLYKKKSSRSRKQKSNLNPKNRELQPPDHFADLNQFADPEPFE